MNFSQRTAHQLRQEFRHHYPLCLAWWIILGLTTAQQSAPSRNYYLSLWSDPLLALTLLGAALLTIRSVASDAPASSDTASLTRPIGRGASWAGKLGFLFGTICIPWWMADLALVYGYNYDLAHWVTLTLSSFLLSLLTVTVCAAIATLPSTRLQFGTLFVTAIAAAGLWFTGGLGVFSALFGRLPGFVDVAKASENRLACGSALATGLAILLAVAAWWLGTSNRSRKQTLILLALALIQWPLLRAHSPIDWLTQPALIYPKGNLELALGTKGPVTEMPGGNLWRFLRIKNLPTGTSATVKTFGPSQTKLQDRYTDFKPKHVSFFTDQFRYLLNDYPPTDLWTDQTSSWRTPLYDFIKPNELRAKNQPWHLDLAIFSLVNVIDVPLADFITTKGRSIALRPGVVLTLFLEPVYGLRNGQLNGEMRARRSAFQPPLPHASTVSGNDIPSDVLVIFHNPLSREHHASVIRPSSSEDNQTFGWTSDISSQVSLTLPVPRTQMFITGLKFEEWVKNVTVSFWLPVERGTTRFEIPAKSLAAAVETAKAEAMK